jgi:hypothetical protein
VTVETVSGGTKDVADRFILGVAIIYGSCAMMTTTVIMSAGWRAGYDFGLILLVGTLITTLVDSVSSFRRSRGGDHG